MGKFDLRVDTSKINIYSHEPQQLDRDVARVIDWFNGIRFDNRRHPLVLKRVTKAKMIWRNFRYEGAWLTFAAKNMIWRELIDMGYVLMNLGKVVKPVATSLGGVRMPRQGGIVPNLLTTVGVDGCRHLWHNTRTEFRGTCPACSGCAEDEYTVPVSIDTARKLLGLEPINPFEEAWMALPINSQVRRTTPPQVFSEHHLFDLDFLETELLAADNYAPKSDVILGVFAGNQLRNGWFANCIVHPKKKLVKIGERWHCGYVRCGFSFKMPRHVSRPIDQTPRRR